MYSWGSGTEDWARPGAYRWDEERSAARGADAAAAAARGGRAYGRRTRPDAEVTDPRKRIVTASANPLIVAVDVTGSMASWPFEIFDRLPLLYQTLSQYRPDLEVSFAAIGDAYCDRWPLQVTGFAKGIELDDKLTALYGEGGGGDMPESYQLFAHWVNERVATPGAPGDGPDGGRDKPFLVVFGDAPFHPRVTPKEAREVLGLDLAQPVDGIEAWRALARRFDAWFLRRPGGRKGDETHAQWAQALGEQRIVTLEDEARAVDYAMGLIARSWGRFDDFTQNLSARQEERTVKAVANSVLSLEVDEPRKPARRAPRDVPDTRPTA